MIDAFSQLLFWLLVGHALADYPLQGEYLALSKDRHHPMGRNGTWMHSLTAHAAIHAGMVAFCTNSILLGMAEFGVHLVTDFLKTEKKINLHVDQAIHVGAKVVWAAIAVNAS